MKKEKKAKYFSRQETALWSFSAALIVASFCIFDGSNHVTLAASLIGVTAILLNAKGNPTGQLLMIVFSLIYGYISFSVAYYGEMLTYLGMTLPMAFFALASWLLHPYNGNRAEVAVNRLEKREVLFMLLLSGAVTAIFYFVLRAFNTSKLLPSTISVTTSFIAVYLTFRRSPYFSLAYALNDIVLLVLWTLASMENVRYAAVVACFSAFLVNDIYAFISWKRMEKRQKHSLPDAG